MPAVCFLFECARRALRGRRGRGLAVAAGLLAGYSAAAQQPAPPEADSLRAALRTETSDSARAKTALRLSVALTATDTAGAGRYARQALALSTRAGFSYGRAVSWLRLSSLAIIRNDNAAADRYGALAQATADQLAGPAPSPRQQRLRAGVANNRGNVAERRGQYAAAVRAYLQAATLLAASPDYRTRLTVYCNIGNCLQELGQPVAAARYWQQAVALAARTGPVPELVPVHVQLATRYLLRAQPDSAWQQLRAARPLVQRNPLYATEFYTQLGEYYLYTRQPTPARAALQQALAAATRKGAAGYQARLLLSLGQLEVALGHPDPAHALMQRSLALTKRLGDAQQELNTLANLGQLEENAGQWQAALGYYRRGQQLRDTLASAAVRRQASTLETQYRTRQQAQQLRDQQRALGQARRLNTVYLALVLALVGGGALALGLWASRRRLRAQRQLLQAQQAGALAQAGALRTAQAVLAGQEEERARVARDLHDGLGGTLATVKLYLGSVRSRTTLPPEPAQLFNQAITHLDEAIAELRRMARHLLPEAVLAFGLAPALRDLCEAVQQTGALHVQLQTHGLDAPRLPPATEVALFRMVQELLTNALRHARARQVLVQLMRHGPELQLVVEDDGQGFDPTAAGAGVGLRSVRTRAAYLGGTLEVQSAPGQGTSVSLDLRLAPADDAATSPSINCV
ncbi:sensor histidine kinase [Hymenobacter sp. H14-R3]|uniref:ATP-binding protein n=1 Tax=Hymenobacter sp. H14-R3 TaxID=3046308 RepID=UPI0024BAFE2F|nr:sensor histidine kinase [Hymenobacter sp. H14-R3]MDJ0365664.1 sensor histidine kinase [Hymenobacter sp. H14-R3]